eukprot:gene3348-6624_t
MDTPKKKNFQLMNKSCRKAGQLQHSRQTTLSKISSTVTSMPPSQSFTFHLESTHFTPNSTVMVDVQSAYSSTDESYTIADHLSPLRFHLPARASITDNAYELRLRKSAEEGGVLGREETRKISQITLAPTLYQTHFTRLSNSSLGDTPTDRLTINTSLADLQQLIFKSHPPTTQIRCPPLNINFHDPQYGSPTTREPHTNNTSLPSYNFLPRLASPQQQTDTKDTGSLREGLVVVSFSPDLFEPYDITKKTPNVPLTHSKPNTILSTKLFLPTYFTWLNVSPTPCVSDTPGCGLVVVGVIVALVIWCTSCIGDTFGGNGSASHLLLWKFSTLRSNLGSASHLLL